MSDLENHFGDDVSLEEKEKSEILAFLLRNSAEKSTKESSVKILASIKNKDIIAITDTIFWKKSHNLIPKDVFNHKEVRTQSNCKACHSDIEKGLIQDDKIKNISDFM